MPLIDDADKRCIPYSGTRNVPQITFLSSEKLNRKGFIRVSSIELDLKYRLYVLSYRKIPLELGCNALFYTNICNGWWNTDPLQII